MRLTFTVAILLLATMGLAQSSCGSDPSPAQPATPPATRTPAAPTRTANTPTSETPSPTPSAATAVPTQPPDALPARVLYRAAVDRPVIALTFDAGSDAGFTSDILRTLRDKNVRATFALTGLWSEQNRDLLLAIAADGHTIMNHSYGHPSFTGRSTSQPPLTFDERALQLARTERTIYRYTSRSTKPLFRPPYGDFDGSVRHDVAAEGYDTIVMWTIDTLGWNGASAADIVARIADGAEPGAIVIMHVGAASQDALALPEVVDNLRAAAYEFVTIDELLALEAE